MIALIRRAIPAVMMNERRTYLTLLELYSNQINQMMGGGPTPAPATPPSEAASAGTNVQLRESAISISIKSSHFQ
jgi:hypothetical protein